MSNILKKKCSFVQCLKVSSGLIFLLVIMDSLLKSLIPFWLILCLTLHSIKLQVLVVKWRFILYGIDYERSVWYKSLSSMEHLFLLLVNKEM